MAPSPQAQTSSSSRPSHRLGDLAGRLGGRVEGDEDLRVGGVESLDEAAATDLALLTASRFREKALASRAGALVVTEKIAADPALAGRTLLVIGNPGRALADLLELFHPPLPPPAGIHETAVVGEGAVIDPTASVGPYAVVGAGSRVGARTVLGAHAVIGRRCRLAADVVLHPHAVLYDGVEIGERSVVHAGTVLGADGFGYLFEGGHHRKIPQVGRVVVESDVEIGANSTIDRATLGATRIGSGTKVDNLVQVGHNVQIGKACVLCGQVGVAGSSQLGDGVLLGGQVGVSDHVELGPGVQVMGGSAVFRSQQSGGLGGLPAMDLRKFRRVAAILPRLEEVLRRLKKLERIMGEDAMGEHRPGEEE